MDDYIPFIAASSHVVIERVKQVTGAISLDHLAAIADRKYIS